MTASHAPQERKSQVTTFVTASHVPPDRQSSSQTDNYVPTQKESRVGNLRRIAIGDAQDCRSRPS